MSHGAFHTYWFVLFSLKLFVFLLHRPRPQLLRPLNSTTCVVGLLHDRVTEDDLRMSRPKTAWRVRQLLVNESWSPQELGDWNTSQWEVPQKCPDVVYFESPWAPPSLSKDFCIMTEGETIWKALNAQRSVSDPAGKVKSFICPPQHILRGLNTRRLESQRLWKTHWGILVFWAHSFIHSFFSTI